MYNPFLMNKGWTILAPSAAVFIAALKKITCQMAKGVKKVHVETNESTTIKHEPRVRETLEGFLEALNASDLDASSESSESTHGGPSNSDDDSVSSRTDKKPKKNKGKSSTKQNRNKAVKPNESDSGDDSDPSGSAKKKHKHAKSPVTQNKKKGVVPESTDEHDSDAEIHEDVVLQPFSESDEETTRKPKRSKKDHDHKSKSKPKVHNPSITLPRIG